MNIVVLDAETLDLPRAEWAALEALGRLELHGATAADPALIIERCRTAEVVLTNKVPLSAEVLAALPQLKLISVLATGYNVIDLAAARSRGVVVCNVPAYSTDSVAQHCLALLLEITNGVGRRAASVAQGDWVRSPHFCYWDTPPVEVSELTVGIVGFGTIGRRFGELVHCLGGRVLANQRTPRNAPNWPGFAFRTIEAIFAEADIVSLHCPQTPENLRFVNAALLARMKRGAWLLNTARGTLVDEADLAAALRAGALGGAALDVLAAEPMRADHPLLGAPRLLITPHVAWASLPARRRLLATTASNLRAFVAGAPANRVG